MVEPAFDRQIQKALDAYIVPAMPQGFSDRLMMRIASGNTGVDAASLPMPLARSRRSSPWRRTSRIMGSLAIFSLATAAAAAAGIFGEPVYVPGVSEALVKAQIVQAPKPALPSKVRMVAKTKALELADVAPYGATGSTAVIERVTTLRNDPQFSELAPRQRMAIAEREVRQMVRSGEVTRQDVRTAVRTLVQTADPATKEAFRAAVTERRAIREERLVGRADSLRADPQVASISPSESAENKSTDAILPTVENEKPSAEKVNAVREQIRTANPEQRAVLRAAIRERRQLRQRHRAQ